LADAAGGRIATWEIYAMTDTNAQAPDAIRYVVLRKLAPGMRHALVGELQALQFSAELAARMVDEDGMSPKLAARLRQMSDQTRGAVNACDSIVGWLRPDDKATTTVEEALPQCLRLAGDDWNLRGIEVSTDVRTGGAMISKPALRELLVTSLLALTDTHPGPIDIEVNAELTGDEVVVRLRAQRAERRSPLPLLTHYRALTYDDIVTVGKAHGIACTYADGTVTLHLRTLPAVG
jgi:hypothetical protein